MDPLDRDPQLTQGRPLSRLYAKLRMRPTERQRMFTLTIAIGGVCGLVAVAFHEAIQLVQALSLDRALAATGTARILGIILIPTLGALLAGVLLHYVVPGARGSGIPQVKVAYTLKSKRLQLRDSVGKFVIGALQIGTGSSLGREGPTVQICAGAASAMGRIAGVAQQRLSLLLPVGAAAGIAAAFNAPIAAVTFTIEEVVGTLDQTLLSGVIIAAALAAAVERSVLGEHPVFEIPQGYRLEHASSLLTYAALGVAAALVSVGFTESLLFVRRWFHRSSNPPGWAKPAVGGLVTGLLATFAFGFFGMGGVTGGGYEVLSDALSGSVVVEVLLGLLVLKFAATVFSYASGGAGGIFAPALFMGGMLGGAFGALDVAVFAHTHAEVGAFALVGMGAVFAGVIRAPITSVLIIIEMTGGYSLALPLMISNMMAYGLARRLRPTPIYEALLDQDGIHLQPRPAADPIDGLTIGGVPLDTTPFASFAADTTADALVEPRTTAGRQEVYPVTDTAQRLLGLITVADLALLAGNADLHYLVCAADVMRPPSALHAEDSLQEALDLMRLEGVRELPVVDADGRVIGLLGVAAIAHVYMQARATRRSETAKSSTVRG